MTVASASLHDLLFVVLAWPQKQQKKPDVLRLHRFLLMFRWWIFFSFSFLPAAPLFIHVFTPEFCVAQSPVIVAENALRSPLLGC